MDDATPAAVPGTLLTEALDDAGRQVTVYVPARPAVAVVVAGDGQLVAAWGADLERPGLPATLVVGVHRLADETQRLHEYSPGFDPDRFAAHERLFADVVPRWVAARFGVGCGPERTAAFGVSAGGELALAMGLRHPDVFGSVLCASPGGGFRPPAMHGPLPRTYLVAGLDEPFFLANAERWAAALRDAGTDVVLTRRPGRHGDRFWREEFPLMAAWAFARDEPPRPAIRSVPD